MLNFKKTTNRFLFKLMILLIIISSNFLNAQVRPSGGKDGQMWVKRSVRPISWNTSQFSNNSKIKIELWNSQTQISYLIKDSVNNSDAQSIYTIPDSIQIGKKYKIIISQCSNLNRRIVSENFFEIFEENYYTKKNIYYENSENKNNMFTLFPNPVKNILNVELIQKSQYSIRITDLTGRVLYSQNMNSSHLELNIDSFNKGVYYLIIEDIESKTSRSEKFIKE